MKGPLRKPNLSNFQRCGVVIVELYTNMLSHNVLSKFQEFAYLVIIYQLARNGRIKYPLPFVNRNAFGTCNPLPKISQVLVHLYTTIVHRDEKLFLQILQT